MKRSLLFLSENLDPESHTTQTISVVERFWDRVILMNLALEYEVHGIVGLQKHIEAYIEKYDVDTIWLSPGASCRVDPIWLFHLRQVRSRVGVVTQFSDSEHLFDCNDKYYAQASDVSLVHGAINQGKYELLSLNVVPGQLFDFSVYENRLRQLTRRYSLSFIGGISRSHRRALINKVKDRFPDMFLAGAGTEVGRVTTEDYLDVLANSKCVLCFSGVESTELAIDRRMTQFKGRFIESVFSGAIPIVEFDYSLKYLCGEYFEHLNMFGNADELIERVDYVLENYEQELEKLLNLRNHLGCQLNSNKLMACLVDHLDSRTQEITGYMDPIYGERFIRERFYYLGRFFAFLRISLAYEEIVKISGYLRYLNFGIIRAFGRGIWRRFSSS